MSMFHLGADGEAMPSPPAPGGDAMTSLLDSLNYADANGRHAISVNVEALRAVLAGAAVLNIDNPLKWYFAADEVSEWWAGGHDTREDAIERARTLFGTEKPVFIQQARRMVADCAVFDAAHIFDEIEQSEVWWEDGWGGRPDEANVELESALADTLRRHIVKHGSLTAGACLDMVGGPEHLDPEALDAALRGVTPQ